MANIVFIACSLDGFIADQHGKLDWLDSVSNPDNIDTGFLSIMERIDGLIMGRNTLETVMSFEGDWPYNKPVFVLSSTMTEVPKAFKDKIFLIKGELKGIVAKLKRKGINNLYIDAGKTIQSFLKEDLIDEIIITQFPILLGGGTPLFGMLKQPLKFTLTDNKVVLNELLQTSYQRKRSTSP